MVWVISEWLRQNVRNRGKYYEKRENTQVHEMHNKISF